MCCLSHLQSFLYSKELNYGFLFRYLLSLVSTQVHGKVFKVMFITKKKKKILESYKLASFFSRKKRICLMLFWHTKHKSGLRERCYII